MFIFFYYSGLRATKNHRVWFVLVIYSWVRTMTQSVIGIPSVMSLKTTELKQNHHIIGDNIISQMLPNLKPSVPRVDYIFSWHWPKCPVDTTTITTTTPVLQAIASAIGYPPQLEQKLLFLVRLLFWNHSNSFICSHLLRSISSWALLSPCLSSSFLLLSSFSPEYFLISRQFILWHTTCLIHPGNLSVPTHW